MARATPEGLWVSTRPEPGEITDDGEHDRPVRGQQGGDQQEDQAGTHRFQQAAHQGQPYEQPPAPAASAADELRESTEGVTQRSHVDLLVVGRRQDVDRRPGTTVSGDGRYPLSVHRQCDARSSAGSHPLDRLLEPLAERDRFHVGEQLTQPALVSLRVPYVTGT